MKAIKEKILGCLDGSMVEQKVKALTNFFLSATDNMLCKITTVMSAFKVWG